MNSVTTKIGCELRFDGLDPRIFKAADKRLYYFRLKILHNETSN